MALRKRFLNGWNTCLGFYFRGRSGCFSSAAVNNGGGSLVFLVKIGGFAGQTVLPGGRGCFLQLVGFGKQIDQSFIIAWG